MGVRIWATFAYRMVNPMAAGRLTQVFRNGMISAPLPGAVTTSTSCRALTAAVGRVVTIVFGQQFPGTSHAAQAQHRLLQRASSQQRTPRCLRLQSLFATAVVSRQYGLLQKTSIRPVRRPPLTKGLPLQGTGVAHSRHQSTSRLVPEYNTVSVVVEHAFCAPNTVALDT